MEIPPRKRLKRIEHPNHLRFVTFSCVDRLPLLSTPALRDRLISCIAESRLRHGFHLVSYVIMPEHVHMLVWPRLPQSPLSRVLSTIKQRFAQRAISRWVELNARILNRITDSEGCRQVWQRGGGYDRNVFSDDERLEKSAYIHYNPVARGLVRQPRDWPWSSAAWYEGVREGAKLAMDPSRRPS